MSLILEKCEFKFMKLYLIPYSAGNLFRLLYSHFRVWFVSIAVSLLFVNAMLMSLSLLHRLVA